MRDDDGHLRAFHAGEEDRRRIEDFGHHETRFELLDLVATEGRPMLGARNDGLERAHHLAAVADAQGEGVLAVEKGGELVAAAVVHQDGPRPAEAGTEHVAIGESRRRRPGP